MSADVENDYPTMAEVERMVARWADLSAAKMLEDILAWDALYGATSWSGRAEAMTLYEAKCALERRDLASFYLRAGVADLPECEVGDPVFLQWLAGKDPVCRELYETIPGALMLVRASKIIGAPAPHDFWYASTGTLWLARASGLSSLLKYAQLESAERQRNVDASGVELFSTKLMDATWLGFPFLLEPTQRSNPLLPNIHELWCRERRLLREAVKVNEGDKHPLAVLRTWMLARHFHASPDIELATDDAWQPEPRAGDVDLLDPRWFLEREDSRSMAEFALAAGAAAGGLPWLLPAVGNKFAQRLELVSKRPMSDSERAHEEHRLRNPPNALGWPSWWPIAPPMLARYILSQWGVGWLASLDDAAFDEMLMAFQEHPSEYDWLAQASIRWNGHDGWHRINALASAWNQHHAALSSFRACVMGANLMRLSYGRIDEIALQKRFGEATIEESPAIAREILRACFARKRHGDDWSSIAMMRMANLANDASITPSSIRIAAIRVMLEGYEIGNAEFKHQFTAVIKETAALSFVQDNEGLRRWVRALRLAP